MTMVIAIYITNYVECVFIYCIYLIEGSYTHIPMYLSFLSFDL